jgi:hypothetical protein
MLCLNKLVCLTLLNTSTAALYLQVFCLNTFSSQGHMNYMLVCLSKFRILKMIADRGLHCENNTDPLRIDCVIS